MDSAETSDTTVLLVHLLRPQHTAAGHIHRLPKLNIRKNAFWLIILLCVNSIVQFIHSLLSSYELFSDPYPLPEDNYHKSVIFTLLTLPPLLLGECCLTVTFWEPKQRTLAQDTGGTIWFRTWVQVYSPPALLSLPLQKWERRRGRILQSTLWIIPAHLYFGVIVTCLVHIRALAGYKYDLGLSNLKAWLYFSSV